VLDTASGESALDANGSGNGDADELRGELVVTERSVVLLRLIESAGE
jgi:hypothetical protein